MQNGGISKASKGINLSEDVFAGYANGVRGGSVGFKEYAQVGKGRDVGLQQIYKFEAKLAQGNAEQCLSRDVDRMVRRARAALVAQTMARQREREHGRNLCRVGEREVERKEPRRGGLGLAQTIPSRSQPN